MLSSGVAGAGGDPLKGLGDAPIGESGEPGGEAAASFPLLLSRFARVFWPDLEVAPAPATEALCGRVVFEERRELASDFRRELAVSFAFVDRDE